MMTEAEQIAIDEAWTRISMLYLWALNVKKRDKIYQGTVPRAIVAKRRAKGRVAKQSRKVNR
jgi:hypothetical protein